MRRAVLHTAMCALAALAAGCSSTPPSRFYTLSSTAAPAQASAPASPLSVVVGPVSIPAMDDMPQIVVSTGPNQVSIDEFNRWASPLAGSIAHTVAEDLAALLDTPRVSLFQQSLNATGDYRVAIEVQRFESAPGEAATLNAVWSVRRTKDGKTEIGRSVVREPASDKSYEALVAAHSRALTRMSQDIATTVLALERQAP